MTGFLTVSAEFRPSVTTFQPFLELAGLIFTVRALQGLVGTAPEALRMARVDDLPVKHDNAGSEEKTPAEEIFDEEHRREHHKVSPVIDAAVDAAFVFHNKGLERTIEKDADVIGEEEEYRQHQQILRSQNADQVKDSEDRVEGKPSEKYLPGLDILVLNEAEKLQFVISLYRSVIDFFGLSKGHGKDIRRKKMGDHDAHENAPEDVYRRDPPPDRLIHQNLQFVTVEDIQKECRDDQRKTQ